MNNEEIEAARKEGEKIGATAERTRIQAILNLPEAKGREASAMHLAFTTDLSADVVKGTLAGLSASTSEQAPEREQKQPQPTGQRSSEAPSGLVTFDPKADQPQTPVEKTKASWGKVTDKLNASM